MKNKFRFQLISDLHLENINYEFNIFAKAPFLILGGDIGLANNGKLKSFLWKTADKFSKVFFVPGNHEYYKNSIEEANFQIQHYCDTAPKKNIIFLNKTSLAIKNLRILGTTLWSQIDKNNYEEIRSRLNDYKEIKINQRILIPNDTLSFFDDNILWLKKELKKAKNNKEKVLIITHHAPSLTMTASSEKLGSSLQSAFCSNLDNLIKNNDHIKIWTYAHTHFVNEHKLYKTRLISNSRGYESALVAGFNQNRIYQCEY